MGVWDERKGTSNNQLPLKSDPSALQPLRGEFQRCNAGGIGSQDSCPQAGYSETFYFVVSVFVLTDIVPSCYKKRILTMKKLKHA